MEDVGPKPGWYALSVNFLRGMKFGAPEGLGGWVPIHRHDYYEYFRAFRPVARAGYSIYIFHITPERANARRAVLGLPPVTLTPAAGRVRPSDDVGKG